MIQLVHAAYSLNLTSSRGHSNFLVTIVNFHVCNIPVCVAIFQQKIEKSSLTLSQVVIDVYYAKDGKNCLRADKNLYAGKILSNFSHYSYT